MAENKVFENKNTPPPGPYGYEKYSPPEAYDPSLKKGKVVVVVAEPHMEKSVMRHESAAAQAARLGAEQAALKSGETTRADVRYVNDEIYDPEKHEAELRKADVISSSHTSNILSGQVPTDMKDFKGIIVTPEGNEGGRLESDRQPDSMNFLQMHPDTIGVGAAGKGNDGKHFVYDYSTPSGPTVLSASPFKEDGLGQRYNYLASDTSHIVPLTERDEPFDPNDKYDNIRREVDARVSEEFKKRHPDMSYAAPEAAALRFKIEEEMAPKFTGAENEAALEEAAQKNAAKNYELYKQQEQERASGELAMLRDKSKVDEQGYSHHISGTSFTAPYVAGQIGSQKEAHPGLTNQELITALTASATPVTDVKDDYATIEHVTTATGRKFDPVYSGWGVLDEKKFAENADLMAKIKQDNPELSSKTVTLTTQSFKAGETTNGRGLQEYSVDVKDDAIVTRHMMHMKFEPGKTGENNDHPKTPEEMFLTSPSGTRMLVPSSTLNSEAYTATHGFTGETAKGTWVLEVPPSYTLKTLETTTHGTERGGVVEKFIEQTRPDVAEKEKAAPEKAAEPKKPEAEPAIKPVAQKDNEQDYSKMLAGFTMPSSVSNPVSLADNSSVSSTPSPTDPNQSNDLQMS